MEKFKEFMDVFYGVLFFAAIGMCAWLYKMKKESDR